MQEPKCQQHELSLSVAMKEHDRDGQLLQLQAVRASVEYPLEHDIEAVRQHDDALVQRLFDGLDGRRYRLTSPEAGPQRSTLVFVEPMERERAEEIQRALQAERVHVAFRAGALRLSPHLYNTPGDIDRALEALHRA